MSCFRCWLLAILLCLTGGSALAQVVQTPYPDNYFGAPLELPVALSGGFGEIRPNHLHSGIDLRTNQEEGYPVHAVAAGYVSRVRVQAFGFGYALYIDHPNGYTSVYGHLKQYNDRITAWVKQKQYEMQQFEVDLFPKPNELPVTKDEIVALTGSSGVSGGPHLHFEIRNTVSEYPINPLFFGNRMADTIPPRIRAFRISPVKGRGLINGKALPMDLAVVREDEHHYRLSSNKPIELSGEIAFSVDAEDFQNGNNIPTGVYSIGFFLDDECYSALRLETFSFKQTRAANSILDYVEAMKSGKRLIRSVVDPWNPLKIYDVVKNNGIFSFGDQAEHTVKCEVKDFFGNSADLVFSVKSKKVPVHPPLPVGYQKVFYGNRNNIWANANVKVVVPKDNLYDTLYFNYRQDGADKRLVSRIQVIQNKFVPVHDFYTLSIRTRPLKPELAAKAVMVSLNDEGGLIAQGGEWSKGFMVARVKEFGRFGVALDTVPPVIRPITNFNNRAFLESGQLQFHISDNLSGIKTFRPYLNGKWVLMNWDGKSGRLTLDLEGLTVPGENSLRIELEDRVGNQTIFEKTFEN